MREHAAQLGIAADRIAVGGFSAGAHLAGLLAATCTTQARQLEVTATYATQYLRHSRRSRQRATAGVHGRRFLSHDLSSGGAGAELYDLWHDTEAECWQRAQSEADTQCDLYYLKDEAEDEEDTGDRSGCRRCGGFVDIE